MIYHIIIQTAPVDAPDYYRYTSRTKSEAVARHHLETFAGLHGFEILTAEWLSVPPGGSKTLAKPGGFPFISLQVSE